MLEGLAVLSQVRLTPNTVSFTAHKTNRVLGCVNISCYVIGFVHSTYASDTPVILLSFWLTGPLSYLARCSYDHCVVHPFQQNGIALEITSTVGSGARG